MSCDLAEKLGGSSFFFALNLKGEEIIDSDFLLVVRVFPQ